LLNRLQALFDVLTPSYNSDRVGNLMLGLVVLRLGRYRNQIDEHFTFQLNPDRSLRALLNLGALYHDVGKPFTRSVDPDGRIRFFEHERVGAEMVAQRAFALRLSNQEIERLQTIVTNHMRPSLLAQTGTAPSRKAVYHFYKATGAAGVEVCLLSLADKLATYGTTLTPEKWTGLLDVVRALLENWWERPQEAVLPPPLVNGHDLMAALAISPGPRVGQILEAIREAQAVGQVTTREEALEFARNIRHPKS
jgi:putative nucleotidyltransferase with HDIG domain